MIGPGTLVALDFDGTLAPVVPRPQDARPAPGAIDVLRVLARTCRRLAVVTGRPAEVVVALGGLADVPGLVVLGHYGLERWADGARTAPAPTPGLEAALAQARALATGGATIEEKGLSFALHTRQTTDPAGALEALRAPVAALAARHGLEVLPGSAVLEVRPGGTDKGGALRSLLAGETFTDVLVAGDDHGDLPMFAAARASGLPSTCLAVRRWDGSAALVAAADEVLDSPGGLVQRLRGLLQQEPAEP